MSKAVLISIQPKWCEKIASGRKTMELRKSNPKLEPPFKCYIYETYDKKYEYIGICDPRTNFNFVHGCGKVIGEFICDYVMRQCQMQNADLAEQQSLVKRESIFEYANGGEVYGWHISELKIYDRPRSLHDLHAPCTPACNFSEECGGTNVESCLFPVGRAPQSWMYVEELI